MSKLTIASIATSAILFSGAALAATSPVADLVWQGMVPSNLPGDTLIITGIGGNEDIAKGSLTIQSDGTFTSSSIIVEARDYTGEVVGDLKTADWKIVNAELLMGSTDVSGATLEVSANGAVVQLQEEILASETLSLSVNQTSELPDAQGQAQVQVTLMAEESV